jgi:hypothetical protein
VDYPAALGCNKATGTRLTDIMQQMVNKRKWARQNKNKNPEHPLQARQESTAGNRVNPQPAITRIHSQSNLGQIDATYLRSSLENT